MNTKENSTIGATETVNALVARVPRSVAVFQRHGIDTCCGGGLPLGVVAERHGLDLDAIVAELAAVA